MYFDNIIKNFARQLQAIDKKSKVQKNKNKKNNLQLPRSILQKTSTKIHQA